MKGNSQEIIGLRQAARRVKEFFSNKPLKFQCAGPEFSQKHLRELVASHHYLLIKSMAALKMMTTFSFSRSPNEPQKKLESSSEPLPISNDQQFSDRIDGTAYGEGGLSLGRVHGWRLKEFFLVKKQLQALRQLSSYTRPHEIFPLLEQDSSAEDLARTQEWQNQLGNKEERQFQITRITKILSR